jgi:hypothetical protein
MALSALLSKTLLASALMLWVSAVPAVGQDMDQIMQQQREERQFQQDMEREAREIRQFEQEDQQRLSDPPPPARQCYNMQYGQRFPSSTQTAWANGVFCPRGDGSWYLRQ